MMTAASGFDLHSQPFDIFEFLFFYSVFKHAVMIVIVAVNSGLCRYH